MSSSTGKARIALFHGNEDFRVDQAARDCLQALCPHAEAQGVLTTLRGDVDTVDGALDLLKQTLTAVQSFSMFGDENVTWLRDVKFLNGKAYKSEDVKSAVERFLKTLKSGLGPEQVLVLSVSGKLDARSKVLKTFQEIGNVQEFSRSDKPWEAEKEDEQTLKRLLADKKIRATQPVLNTLLDRIGGGDRIMMQEVEKLDLYMGDRRDLRVEDVDLMVSPMREIAAYSFGDAVAEQNLDRALYLLQQMETQKVSPIALIAQLHNLFREMALYRSLLGQGLARLETGSGRFGNKFHVSGQEVNDLNTSINGGRKPSPFRQAQLAAASMRHSLGRLDRMVRMTAEAYRQQFLSGLPGYLQLELLLLRLVTEAKGGVA